MPIELTPRLIAIAQVVAKKYARSDSQLDDAVSAANLGIVKAARTWLPDRGTKPETWLFNAAEYAVKRELMITRNRYGYGQSERWARMQSLSSPLPNGDGCLGDGIPAHQAALDLAAEQGDLAATILGRLNTVEREIVRLRAVEDLPWGEIGSAMDLKRDHVRATYDRLIRRLRYSANRNYVCGAEWLGRLGGRRGSHPAEMRRRSVKGHQARSRNARRLRHASGHPDLPMAQGRVLALLAGGPKDTGRLAEALGTKTTYVRNAVAALGKRGLVERCGGGGMGGSVVYRLSAPAAVE